jgi:AraC family transcriptional regulator, regulatory protein of adaptative response / methylated-DNA-[protein]-cysteine methyltransferase
MNTSTKLPPRTEMVRAYMERDTAYEGIFYLGVKTTGIFCRPTCAARKPFPENVEFYETADDALAAGFRPCRRCKPLDAASDAPEWVRDLLGKVSAAPTRRWTDEDLMAIGVDPTRVRRWFKQQFGMTFHDFVRSRRLGLALDSLKNGNSLDDAALDHGYESLSGFRDGIRKTFGATPTKASGAAILQYTRIATPLGPMIAMAEERGLVMLEFIDRPALTAEIEELRTKYGYAVAPGTNLHLKTVEDELTKYFAGELQRFTVLLKTPGSEFEVSVWKALQEIPFGETRTYGEIATALGKPSACRAVGLANGRNRMSIVVPCHRVIGADGSLTGYGGGKPRKAFLLRLERDAQMLRETQTALPLESVS